MNKITIKPIIKAHGSVYLPGSKSISNRALILSSILCNKIKLINVLNCDDVNYMINALIKLGINIKKIDDNAYIINNNEIPINKNIKLFVGNSGTTMRFLTSLLSINRNNIILDGDNRMRERPINDLVDALRQGGAKIEYIEKENYPPICIKGGYEGGTININGNISSQFLTSILMISPILKKDTIININNELVSKPYIDTTILMMKYFGINIYNKNYKKFYIKGNSNYIPIDKYNIEGDASSASYFLAAGVIKKGPVRVYGINKNSIQADIGFINLIKNMGGKINYGSNYIESYNNDGILNNINIDVNNIPDSAMTGVILSLFVNNKEKSIFKNIYNWRLKETDRLKAMSNELKKIGAYVEEGIDFISVKPPIKFKSSDIETYNDHRIAMCFSLIALSETEINIINPDCVNKTFPDFFKLFNSITIKK